MTSSITTAWLQARFEATQAEIEAYETAITALASGAQSYTLDTGQTRISKTAANLTEMKNHVKDLWVKLHALDRRINGGQATCARPAW